jgi:predicted dehydrogenase
MKVAVIGVGSMGRNHARVYSELAEAELVAVSDADPKLADSLAQKFGARFYTDYRELLEKEKPAAVSIAVPTVLHEEVGMAALEAGAHVLMEKPIAATVEAGRRLIVKAKDVGRQLMVGHIVRFNPAIQALKQKLDAGELGRIFQVFCRGTVSCPHPGCGCGRGPGSARCGFDALSGRG